MRKIETTKSDIDLERNKLCRYIDNTNYSHKSTKEELKELVEKHFKTHNLSEKLGEIKYYFLTN